MSAIDVWREHGRNHDQRAQAGTVWARSTEEDRLLTVAEACKAGGITVSTWAKLPAGERPATLWLSDVRRWAAWMASCRTLLGGATL